MIVINELHPVCSHLQRLHIVCIVKARLIREIVKVIIWVGETNDYCYIWVGTSERLISEASRLPKKHEVGFTAQICKKSTFRKIHWRKWSRNAIFCEKGTLVWEILEVKFFNFDATSVQFPASSSIQICPNLSNAAPKLEIQRKRCLLLVQIYTKWISLLT